MPAINLESETFLDLKIEKLETIGGITYRVVNILIKPAQNNFGKDSYQATLIDVETLMKIHQFAPPQLLKAHGFAEDLIMTIEEMEENYRIKQEGVK